MEGEKAIGWRDALEMIRAYRSVGTSAAKACRSLRVIAKAGRVLCCDSVAVPSAASAKSCQVEPHDLRPVQSSAHWHTSAGSSAAPGSFYRLSSSYVRNKNSPSSSPIFS